MKYGYAFTSQRANGFGQQNISGQAGFNFLETGVPGVTRHQRQFVRLVPVGYRG